MDDLLKIFGIDPDTFTMKKAFAVGISTGLIFVVLEAIKAYGNLLYLWLFAGVLSFILLFILYLIFLDYLFEDNKRDS